MSANQDAESDRVAPQRRPPVKLVSRPTKRSAGARTGNPSKKPTGVAVGVHNVGIVAESSGELDDPFPVAAMTTVTEDVRQSTSLVVEELRPRQVIAASLLASGKRGQEVAATLNVAEETVSRWKAEPAFRGLLRQLVQEHIDSVQLGMISLTTEAITHLHYLINGFSDETSLKACALVLGKVSPVLGVIGAKLRQPPG